MVVVDEEWDGSLLREAVQGPRITSCCFISQCLAMLSGVGSTFSTTPFEACTHDV